MTVLIDFTGTSTRAKLWLGDELNVMSTTSPPLFSPFRASVKTGVNYKRIVLEFTYYTGKQNYAMVGGTFQPDDTGTFVGILRPNVEGTAPIDWSLMGSFDQVYLGLPDEYHQALKDVLSSPTTSSTLGSGVLELDTFAHGLYGSSYVNFYIATCALIAVLASDATTSAEFEYILRPKLVRRPYDRPFWIEFESVDPSLGHGLEFGFGATTSYEYAAMDLLSNYLKSRGIGTASAPTVARVIENIDVTMLDPINVQPFVGDISKPGIWFPRLPE